MCQGGNNVVGDKGLKGRAELNSSVSFRIKIYPILCRQNEDKIETFHIGKKEKVGFRGLVYTANKKISSEEA